MTTFSSGSHFDLLISDFSLLLLLGLESFHETPLESHYIHHPRHGYFDVIEVLMTDRAVEIGILVVGRDCCRHKLWRPISVELTN